MGFWDSFKAAFFGQAGVDYYAMKTRDEVQGLREDLRGSGESEFDLSRVGDGAFNSYVREFDRLDRGVQHAIAKYRLAIQGSEANTPAVVGARGNLRTSVREAVAYLRDETREPVSTLYLKVLNGFVRYTMESEALVRALEDSASGEVLESRLLDQVEKASERMRMSLKRLANT